MSCPAASASASTWPVRWRLARSSSLPTSPPRCSTSRYASVRARTCCGEMKDGPQSSAFLYITHDIATARYLSRRRRRHVQRAGSSNGAIAAAIIDNPQHPYTEAAAVGGARSGCACDGRWRKVILRTRRGGSRSDPPSSPGRHRSRTRTLRPAERGRLGPGDQIRGAWSPGKIVGYCRWPRPPAAMLFERRLGPSWPSHHRRGIAALRSWRCPLTPETAPCERRHPDRRGRPAPGCRRSIARSPGSAKGRSDAPS
jgi:hypothetical protein